MTALHLPPSAAAATLAILGMMHSAAAGSSPLLINESSSVPRGMYLRTSDPVAVSRVVVVSPPPNARAYLSELGAPPDAQLLKRVAAVGGELVCIRDGRLAWPRGAVRALSRDRAGRRLPVWRGCRRLAAEELLVVGDTAASFDSRYFGPIDRAEVRGVYREVWRW